MSNQNNKKKYVPRSYVWNYFTLKTVIGTQVTECLLCHKTQNYCGSTSSMIHHLKNFHQITNSTELSGDINDNYYEESANLDMSSYDTYYSNNIETPKSRDILNSLIAFIVATNQPLSLVDHSTFKAFVNNLNSKYKLPCRQNLTYSLIPKKANEIKKLIMSELTNIPMVTITADNWTSVAINSYLGITCHYVNSDLKLVHRCLCLRYISETKTIDNLGKALIEVFKEWKIDNKVLASVTDSCNNIFGAAKSLSTQIKLPCAGHRLNLCLNDLLTVKKIKQKSDIFSVKQFDDDGNLKLTTITADEKSKIEDDNKIKTEFNLLLAQCRHLVGSFRHDEKLRNKLNDIQNSLNYSTKKQLIQDVKTRWNSTYEMLDTISMNKTALNELRKISLLNKNIKDFVPNDDQYELIDEFCDLLEPIKNITDILSGSNYVTISLLYPLIRDLVDDVIPKKNFKYDKISKFKDMILGSLVGRFNYVLNENENNKLFIACAFLNPNFKNFDFLNDKSMIKSHLKIAKNYLIEFYDRNISKNPLHHANSISNNSNVDSNSINQTNSNSPIQNNPNLNSTNQTNPNSTQISAQVTQVIQMSNKVMNKTRNQSSSDFLKKFVKLAPNLSNEDINIFENELEAYVNFKFSLTTENELYDPLLFFRNHQTIFPLLTEVSKLLFSIVASSVPSEQLFSSTGNICTDLRNRLSPSTLENITLIKENVLSFKKK
jgi:hypothetical protein